MRTMPTQSFRRQHPDSDDDADTASLSTIDDIDGPDHLSFGHPLERMIALESLDDLNNPNPLYHSDYSSCSSDSLPSISSSSLIHDIDFEALIDSLLSKHPLPLPDSRNMLMVDYFTPTSTHSIMVKYFQTTCPELFLLLELNLSEPRKDPWNPAPHILCAIERTNGIFLCMDPLNEYDSPPFKTVANYIDFFRQTLEALTFLHEHKIAQLSCLDPGTFMVDLGVDSSPDHFDRSTYPVRYYCTNFSNAVQFKSSPSDATPFRRDVQEWGMFIDTLLVDVPRIAPKLKSLVNAMTSGAFGADDARKLFEALCKSLESSVFDIPVVQDTTFLNATPVPSGRTVSFASSSTASSHL